MKEERRRQLTALAKKWSLALDDFDLLDIALTHATYSFENRTIAPEHNQRLEFLGDAVLSVVVSEYLYSRYPEEPEGGLTKMRAALVCETTLARKASHLEMGSYLLVGRGEELTGGRERPSILADSFEAVVGAIYLAQGLEGARNFVLQQLGPEIEHSDDDYGDYKTVLQEFTQRHFEQNVAYTILEESGPDHDKRFVAGVLLGGKLCARGKGRSKKQAEQQAARQALTTLGGS